MDFTSHKVNEILVEGGFAPEWIVKKKDIRDDMNRIRKALVLKRQQLPRTEDMKDDELQSWRQFCLRLAENDVRKLNKTIDQFNLVVPMMNGQMFHFDLTKEADKILQNGQTKNDLKPSSHDRGESPPKSSEMSFLDLVKGLVASYVPAKFSSRPSPQSAAGMNHDNKNLN